MLRGAATVWALLLCSAAAASFPPGFRFGAATSAYQVEGSRNISESIWHRFSYTAGKVAGGASGDVACDSYTQWQTDVRLARDLGLHHYRFSISWARLLPSALPDRLSEAGVQYYNNLIDGLLAAGIEPVVTLYHWDLPQRLQDLGGWANPLIAEWFADYARVAFTLFGDRVPTWLTINEPKAFCDFTYSAGVLAPGILDPQLGTFLCIKHALLAHATAWRIYDREFRHLYHGRVSYTELAVWMEPQSPADEELASLANEYATGVYTHPVYSVRGGWPGRVAARLRALGRRLAAPRALLPDFTPRELRLVRGTFDFLGLNYYISRAVRAAAAGEPVPASVAGGAPALGAIFEGGAGPGWSRAGPHPWFTVFPAGLRRQLGWFRQQYGDIPQQIMELGYPDSDPTLDDQGRIRYLREHMEQVLLALEDGVPVQALTVWALMDNFEWADGYNTKFGLYHVDFSSANRSRTPRASARFYADVISSARLPRRAADEL